MARYNPNPFYVHPGNDLTQGLDGLGQVLAESRTAKEEQAMQEAQQQRIAAAQQAARQALQSDDPMLIADVAIEYPELADMMNKQAGIIDDAKKQDAATFSTQLLAASPEQRAAVYQQRIKQLSEQGRDPSHTMQSYRDYLADPDKEMRGVETLYKITNPEAYKAYKESTLIEAPETRELKQGDRIITQQYDPATGKWSDIADASRFNPKSGVNIDFGGMMGGAPELGKLSTDYGYVLDPQTGRPVINAETGLPVAAPVPGSKAALEISQADEKKGNAQNKDQSTANLVTEDIGRAKDIIKKSPSLTTGFLGPVISKWGGTPAADLDSLLDTVGANISFDYLNTMRQNSPTGGALGNVTERELDLLRATAGNLKQSQSAEQLTFNLSRLERQFNQVIHGSETQPPSAADGVPEGVDPEAWKFMTPEQKSLWN